MAISLKFFMIKRGLTIEKMAQKSNAKTPEEMIAYAKTLDIGVTNADEVMIRDYYKVDIIQTPEVPDSESIAPTSESTKPVLEKKSRGKKKSGHNV